MWSFPFARPELGAKADLSVSRDLPNGRRIVSGKKPNHPKLPKRCKNDEKTVIKLCKNSDARGGAKAGKHLSVPGPE
jgi:hypothetical protein